MRCAQQDTVKTRVNNAATAAQTAINTSIIDMEPSNAQAFDAATFDIDLGVVTDGCVFTATVMGNSTSSTAGATAVTGAVITFTAATSSNQKLLIDVIRSKWRFLFVAITRTAQNAGVDSVSATQYRARAVPTTQPATTTSVVSTPEV